MNKVNRKLSTALVLAACVISIGAQAGENDRNKSKKDGTIIGGVLGAVIGAAAGGSKSDIAIGAAVGAAAGRHVGDGIDDRNDRRDDGYGRDDRGRGPDRRDDGYGRDDRGRGRYPAPGRGRGYPPPGRRYDVYQCQETGRGRFTSFVVVDVRRNQIVADYGRDYRGCERAADYYNRGR